MAYDDKATVSIDSEGAVLKCAKGLEASECGFTPGAKVCGKCGAMPVEMKMVPATDLDIADEDMTEDEMQKMYGMMPKKKKKPGMHMMPDGSMMADEDMQKGMDEGDEEEEMGEDEVKINTSMDKFKKKGEDEEELDGPQSDEDEFEADVQDEDEMGLEDDEADPEEEMDSEDDEDMAEAEKVNIMMDKFKKQRLSSMGIKSEDIGEHGYVCAIERKSYSGTTSVCENCPGGCIAEKGMPGLLHVEGMAEDMFDGKVIDSGYSPDADMFVVDVQAKDGKAIEVFIDGTSAEVMGWHKL
jgi:hypothetical protein